MDSIYDWLYLIAVAAFAAALILPPKYQAVNLLAVGLLAWALVPFIHAVR